MKCLILLALGTLQAAELTDYQLFEPPTVSVTYQALIAIDFTVDNTITGQYNFTNSYIKAQTSFLTIPTKVATETLSTTYNQLYRFDSGFIGGGAGINYLHERWDDYSSEVCGQVNGIFGVESRYAYFLADVSYLTNQSHFIDLSLGLHTGHSGYLALVQHWEAIDVNSPRYYGQTYLSSQTGAQFVYNGSTMAVTVEVNTKGFLWGVGAKF